MSDYPPYSSGGPGYPGKTTPPYEAPTMINPDINQIEEYTAWSVVNILCCCCCLGIAACYFSVETGNAKKRGDLQAALSSSRTARTLNIIATVLGLIIIVINIIVQVTAK